MGFPPKECLMVVDSPYQLGYGWSVIENAFALAK
jgi:hypothetical protein